ncbi:TIGR03557 family F420-dependent LLM class oxidoreductase [Blastococcus sp. TML/M2B]|uniref:TIGR03557 family F420-dependent LLM class oxidoreductase n=1 Tax=unclassified Blastococcus TaxID=2619396 RepID=UPI00190CCEB8|nr:MULTISPECIES: TIGR03557 family F420-dependent LLM class oxidoreductase [unclassified Blastococcus]MBN1091504.1 TIGR03557 family F420-dependent LLM class oxidoreductase [Blastococcus sp. TML/M2B]MBN1094946.1 TIGR03557 family F420-dependent LLM class oxidoreductase [Blastococcus sp. TML/C7B]
MAMQLGYTMMTEQAGPKDLVRHVVGAEEVGFDFSVSSDHYFPWLDEMGHSPHAWTVLGAAAQATSRIPLMTYVTCPSFRYHPAVVAQKAATLQILSDGRFTLGLGAGENLNEHVVGAGWPPADVRQEMLEEGLHIIRELFDGEGYTNFRGEHFDVESAKLWDLPEKRVPIGVASGGKQASTIAGQLADALIATEPKAELIEAFDAAGGAGKPRIAQMPISYGTDKAAAVTRAHTLFRWFGFGWKVNAELPGPSAFDAAAQFVREEDVADSIPCGDDVEAVIEAAKEYAEAGFTHLALVQIGGDQQEPYLEWTRSTLLPAWREAFGG